MCSKCTIQDVGTNRENQQVNVIFSFSPLGEKIVYKEGVAVVPTNPQWTGLHTFAWLVGLNPLKHSFKTCSVCLQISELMEDIHHSHVCTVKSIDVVYKSNVSWGICQPSMFSKTCLFLG